MSSNVSHILRLQTHAKNICRHMQITNQARNGIKNFKEYTLSWTSALDYRLVKPAHYATGMFAVDEHSPLACDGKTHFYELIFNCKKTSKMISMMNVYNFGFMLDKY